MPRTGSPGRGSLPEAGRSCHHPAAVPTFYKLVERADFTIDDFKSDRELGKRPAPWEEPRHREGQSVWETRSQAHSLARWMRQRARKRGQPEPVLYIVAIDLGDPGPLRWERSGPSPGHHTLYGPAADVLARAQLVGTVGR